MFQTHPNVHTHHAFAVESLGGIGSCETSGARLLVYIVSHASLKNCINVIPDLSGISQPVRW